ncbi:MAG: biotin attachment protein [Chloroflexi bacterium]|nr:biotin attachment protein [Chloroflexota bacterium]MBI5290704.1 biotin attachment protein [Chloroflexota bacterium]MBI5830001.1 biotin attachment protein [Chloroflexota bacterium]
MSENIILPKWGLTMEEGMVTAWRKQEGDAVSEGEALADVETDKINNELPSPISGIVARILVPVGEAVPVGTTLAIVAANAEEAAQIRASN